MYKEQTMTLDKEQLSNKLPPLVIIAGPTATGKSALAVELAEKLNGSIISADSMQVYRGMDIGSAKVTMEEMRGIPHYLVDIADPDEEWNVVRFQQEAKKALSDIYAKGRLPFLVGGTGFYIQALLYDIDFTEMETDGTYRARLESIAAKEGPEELYRRLVQVDPEAARQIHPHNVKRIIRALEFKEKSGKAISTHNEEQHQRTAAFNALFFVLTMDRQRLYERINERVDQMVGNGLLQEVTALKQKGLTSHNVSMQGIGYKEVLQYLESKESEAENPGADVTETDKSGTTDAETNHPGKTGFESGKSLPASELLPEEVIARIKTDTRHFAKRQLTWFRREKNVIWVNLDEYASEEKVAADLLEQIGSHYGLNMSG